MKIKLIYALGALMMTTLLIVSCSKGGDEPTPEPSIEEQTYTVTFDANGGEGTMSAQKVVENIEATLTVNAFTRTDYSFSGWNTTADGSGTSCADGAKVTLSTDLTLYAQWIENAPAGLYLADVSASKIPEGDNWTFLDTDATAGDASKFARLKAALECLDDSRAINLDFPNLTTIPEEAFFGHRGSKWSITANNVTTVGAEAFRYSHPEFIDLPNAVKFGNNSLFITHYDANITIAKYAQVEVAPSDMFDNSESMVNLYTHPSNVDFLKFKYTNGTLSNPFISVNGEKGFVFDSYDGIIIEGAASFGHMETYPLYIDDTETLYIGTEYLKMDYPNAKWSSSDPSIVSISKSEGSEVEIKVLKVGESRISVQDDHENTFWIDILAGGAFSFADDAEILVKGEDEFETCYSIHRDEYATLTIGNPSNMECYDYPYTQWWSSDRSIVETAKNNGSEIVIKGGYNDGIAKIIAEDRKGNRLYIQISVHH